MIISASKYIVALFLKHNVIAEEEAPVYDYGVQLLVSTAVSFVLILGISMLFSQFWLGVLYLALLVPIRMITGGYHADTYFVCNTVFGIVYLLVILSYLYLEQTGTFAVVLLSNTISFALTCVCAPVSNHNKPLTMEKKKRFKKISAAVVFPVCLFSTLLSFQRVRLGFFISLTILAIALLMVAGIIKERRKACEN